MKMFNIDFDFYFSRKNDAADGIALIFHNDKYGFKSIGSAGDGLGAFGIQNGIVLEVDAYNNEGDQGIQPAFLPYLERFGNKITFSGTLYDGKQHSVRVVWNAESNLLSYGFDGKTTSVNVDLVKQLQSNYGYLAISGSTGGSSATHIVKINNINN